ncbi:MAG: hypothetical protein AMQ74_00342 [Candidatus Methanofastidiosum methylothiophilum]|uniref:DUF1883 domain-containing protein n=1 Tax=Candidatus Methanofastidiosum methylothiophilum TaxID=1705564 RepID=A0A150J8Q2_9EURY|nr:MAG: hypothetical protein AMQ74_00342 [Candidatus Methanofastidiosum methylthiophilus]
MTSDFKPGKAYLVGGKGIEQVKSEIKEWLAQKEIETEEKGDFIQLYRSGYKTPFHYFALTYGYSDENKIKLVPHDKGTLVIFSENSTSMLRHGMRKNLVRSMQNKKEIMDPDDILLIAGIICMIILLIWLRSVAWPRNGYNFLYNIPFIAITLILVLYFYLRQKSLLANPDYYIEEYAGYVVPQDYGKSGTKRRSICPSCNKETYDSWDICLHCGKKLEHRKDGQSRKNEKYFLAVIVFVMLLSGLIILYGNVSLFNYPSSPPDYYSYSIVYSSNGYMQIKPSETFIVKTDISGGYRLLFDYNISSPIKVLCMDSDNYDLYKKEEDCNFYNMPDKFANGETYFQAPYSGTWHIIFYNNSDQTVKANILIMRKNRADTYKTN